MICDQKWAMNSVLCYCTCTIVTKIHCKFTLNAAYLTQWILSSETIQLKEDCLCFRIHTVILMIEGCLFGLFVLAMLCDQVSLQNLGQPVPCAIKISLLELDQWRGVKGRLPVFLLSTSYSIIYTSFSPRTNK